MWVLDAWKDAEKVWFPVVWEEIKDASNVIDYDIRPEQTKDISAEINANNMTTTGMATVIPWVNAPKLLASTSIIWDLWWWGTMSATASDTVTHTFDWAEAYNTYIKTFTITDESWTEKLVQTADWLKIPSDWVYMLDMEYWWISWNMDCTDNLLVNWTTVNSFVWDWDTYHWNNPKEKLFLSLNKWDILSAYIQMQWNDSSYYTFSHLFQMKITKL